jgi:predicted dithiol-disulfide oxidoreductase (DUF899 family)
MLSAYDGDHRKGRTMNLPRVVTRDEGLAACQELLVGEKEATGVRDELRAERRAVPMVEIEKEYTFEGPDGPAVLLDLFDVRAGQRVLGLRQDVDRTDAALRQENRA